MNGDFYQQMGALRQLVAPLAQAFRHPDARSLVIRRRYVPAGETMPITDYLAIIPWPLITTVEPKLGSAFQGQQDIVIEITDFQVKGIDRSVYTSDLLVGSGLSYFIDAEISPSGDSLRGGTECEYIALRSATALTYDLILRAKSEQAGSYH
jgi:hypothetical protein